MKKLLCVFAVLFSLCHAQRGLTQTGAYPYVTLDNKGFDSINPGNTNVRFSIPIVSRTGRGVPFNYAIQYEGLVWTPTISANGTPTWVHDPTWGFHGAVNGTSLAGNLNWATTTGSACPAGSPIPKVLYESNFTYYDTSGASHVFDFNLWIDCNNNETLLGTGTTSDGSGYTLLEKGTQVRTASGATITPTLLGASGGTSISDGNGNQITSDGNGNFTDTLGVKALTVAGGTQPTTFTYPVTEQANGATTATATITYGTYTIQTNFQAINMWTEVGPISGVSLPSQIALADGSTYKFTYEATPGYAGNVTGRLGSVTLPNGGVIQYTYPGCNKNGGMQPDGSPCLMQRITSDGTKWYYHGPATAAPYTTFTIDEANNETDYSFQLGTNGNAYEVHHTAYQGAPASTDLMEYDVYYNSDWGHSQTISSIDTVDLTLAQNGQRLYHTTASLNNSGQITSFLERDKSDNLLRQTTYTYDANNHNLDQFVGDASNNMISHNSYGYDETNPIATGNIPQHGAKLSGPGNRTSVHQWLDGNNSLNTTSTYYDTGAVQSTTSPSGTTTYGYDATQAFATQTNLPTPSSGVALSTSASYDRNSAALLTATGYNAGQTVSVTQYDPLSRPTFIAKPDGGTTKIIYWPGGVSYNSPLDSSKYAFQQTVYDGYGRPRRTAVYNGTAWYLTDTCYTATGQVQAVSIPYLSTAADPSGNRCASGTANTYTYDALGRVKTVTHPDGKQASSNYLIYNGAFSTLNIDELGHIRITDTDALSRPVIACEVSNTTQANGEAPTVCNTAIGATGFKTTYAYNLSTHTTTVTQGAQTRTFQTDALGRTIFTKEPERGMRQYSYAYQGNELLATRYQPQANQPDPGVGVAITTRYDTLGRPTVVTYVDKNNTGKTLQAPKLFYYDGGGPSQQSSYASANAKGLLSQAYVATGDTNFSSTRFTYDIMGRIAGMYECTPGWCSPEAIRGMYRSYAYDYTGNNTNESWTIGYNGQGGLASVGLTRNFTVAGELDSMLGGVNDGSMPLFPYFYKAGPHTPQGTTNEQFGNGLQRNAVYDANGLDAGKFVCSGTVQPDCNGGTYIYGYRDTIVGHQTTHLGDTTLQRTSDMQYDDLGRLKSLTSDSGFNMSWTYDRYGNRYSQSTSVAQPGSSVASYNVATNRVAFSGTPSSPNANPASYDAAGNMLSEGLHGYAYDQEGNLLTVDNNAVVNFYDALNRRVAQSTPGRFERYEYNASGQVSEVWYNEEQYERLTRYTVNGQPLGYWTSNGNLANLKMHFQHPDYLGTVRYVTSDTGAGESVFVSTPFGENYASYGPDDDRSHFAELEHDTDSNTDHAQYRQYASLLGRWHSPDPYDGSYDSSNPQSFNRYSYALNSPLSYKDPSGLDWCSDNGDGDPGYCDDDDNGDDGGDDGQDGSDLPDGGYVDPITGIYTLSVYAASSQIYPQLYRYQTPAISFSVYDPFVGTLSSAATNNSINTKHLACAADAAINFGLGFIPGYNAAKLIGQAAGLNFNFVQNGLSGKSIITAGPTPFSGAAALGSTYSLIKTMNFNDAGGMQAFTRLNSLTGGSWNNARTAINELEGAASTAGTVANLLNTASAAYDIYQCYQTK